MDLPRAVGVAGAMFLVSLVINAGAGRVIGVNLAADPPAELPWTMWLVAMLSGPALAGVGARYYFSSGTVARTGAAGLALGVVWLVTGIVLDALFILPLKSGVRILGGYFRAWQYWFTLALIFGICGVAGAWPLGT
jgi:hypothetical protein